MLVDSHAHLDFEGLRSDIDQVLKRARDAGVEQILTIGCLKADGSDNEAFILRLIEEESGIVAAFGVHPHDADHWSGDMERRLLKLLNHPRVVALGEIGLDFYYDNSPREAQRRAFQDQLQVARTAGKPIIVHSRDADGETCEILRSVYTQAGQENPGVLHCFTGSQDMARECVSLGFYIGVGGIFTFKKSGMLRKAIEEVPFEKLLVETDSPFLAPEPHRGKRNEPAFVRIIAECLAQARECTLAEVGRQTSANFDRLFAG